MKTPQRVGGLWEYWKKKENSLKNIETPSLDLCLDENCLSGFYSFLQSGVRVKIQVGRSVNDTLSQEFGLDAKHIEKIETIFLDSKAVDDLDVSMVRDGSVLALSSAMPGLVGATLRRGSYYAAMRSQITAAASHDKATPQEGMITLKLFNLVLRELAPLFLKRGVWLGKEALRDFLSGQPQGFWKNCKEVRNNGHPIAPEKVAQIQWSDAAEYIFLSVSCIGSGAE
jgi:hypothetical protein